MIRSDNSINIDLYDIETFSNKESIRKFLLHTWAEEKIYKKYRYFVELLDNNQRIYLERPGRLNKGCDFVIFVENQYLYKNGNDKPPSHDYVFNDLAQKKQFLNTYEWKNLHSAIKIIYDCGSYHSVLHLIDNLPTLTYGLSYEALLKLIRWFFIEQDLTYWSGEGRKMFYTGLKNV